MSLEEVGRTVRRVMLRRRELLRLIREAELELAALEKEVRGEDCERLERMLFGEALRRRGSFTCSLETSSVHIVDGVTLRSVRPVARVRLEP